jgi:predicted RND superfamily exporter protein
VAVFVPELPAQSLVNFFPTLADHWPRARAPLFMLMLGLTVLSAWSLMQKAERGGSQYEKHAGVHREVEDAISDLMAEFNVAPESVILVIEGEDLFGVEGVAATRALVAALESSPIIKGIAWVDAIPADFGSHGTGPLLPKAGATAGEFRAARERLLDHPLIGGHLLAASADMWVLPVQIDFESEESRTLLAPGKDPFHALEDKLAAVDTPPGMSSVLTGSWPLAIARSLTFQHEQWLFHGLAYVVTFLLATCLFKSFWAIVVSGGGPVLGVLWTFGLLEFFGHPLNGLTRVILPIMLMMIGFTDSVHLMIHVRDERSRGLTPLAASASAIRALALPCWLTSFTTALGFASLLFARTLLIRDFGFACLIGSLSTFLAVIVFLPLASSTFIGRHLVPKAPSALSSGALPYARQSVAFLMRHARAVAAIGIAVTVAFLSVSYRVENDNRVSSDIPRSSPAARALVRIDEKLGGTIPLSIFVDWEEATAGNWTRICAAVEAARAQLAQHKVFSDTIDLNDLFSVMPSLGDSLASRAALLPIVPKIIRERVVWPKQYLARIEARLPDRGYGHYRSVFEVLTQELIELSQAHPGFKFSLGGQAILSGRMWREVSADLMQSLVLASLTIFGVLAVAFRSLRMGLISVIPNAFPLAATAATLVLLDLPMAGATAFVMSLGIAVDDTIHVVARFRRERALGKSLEQAIEASFIGVGKALLITTLVLVAGFAPVLTSEFPRNQMFSAMICFTVTAALIGDLIILPALLRLFGNVSIPDSKAR